ncbi:hypothetical protein [Actinoplanes sp. NPDC020271]|uniref:hypothetical protein n=1 Tax=Actinoplanes sp. NPDC020271 TaxID=3363896 RepID=UPI003790F16E
MLKYCRLALPNREVLDVQGDIPSLWGMATLTRGAALILALYAFVPATVISLFSLAFSLLSNRHIGHFPPRLPALGKRMGAANPFRAPVRAVRMKMQSKLDRYSARCGERATVRRALLLAMARRIAPPDIEANFMPSYIAFRNLVIIAFPVMLAAVYGAIAASAPILAYGGLVEIVVPLNELPVAEPAMVSAFIGAFTGGMVCVGVITHFFDYPRPGMLRTLRRARQGLDARSMYSAAAQFASDRLHFLSWVIAFWVPLSYLAFVAETVPSTPEGQMPQPNPPAVVNFVKDWFLVVILASVIVASFGWRRRSARMRALSAVLTHLDRYDEYGVEPQQQRASSGIDNKRRIRLAKLADRLDYLARPMSRPLSRRSAVNPTALIMRAAARNIRTVLRSRDSLHVNGLDITTKSLRGLAVCLAESVELDMVALADGVGAYAEDGTPAEDLIEPVPGRISRLTRKVSASLGGDLERPVKVLQNIGIVIGAIVALYAFLIHGDLDGLKDAIPK